ncbi:HdeD family acid-resistance protein [Holdemania massiliensis]|uniref:HdeD family acid-resistance protein n=1 Tax=Holdemania massiliensis TaxID=1468449 RepID=UPI0035627CB4
MFIYNSGQQESFYEMQNKINRKLRSLRRLGLGLAAALVLLGIALLLCPQSIVLWIERGIAVILGLVGILEIVDYLSTSTLFRQSLTIVRGLLDLVIAVLFLRADAAQVITMLSFILGISALLIGIHKLDYAMKLNYFHVAGSGMAILGGLLSILAGIGFLISPLSSAIVLTTLIAAYCILGGIALFIEMLSFKNR